MQTTQALISAQKPRSGLLWVIAYGLVLFATMIVLFSAVTTAPVVWNAEAELGHTLDCHEAFMTRSIAGELYYNHNTTSTILYWTALFPPLWIVIFGLVTVGFFTQVRMLESKIRGLAVSVGLALIAMIVVYYHPIQMIACATE